MKVAYLGPEGSYTHISAKNIFATKPKVTLVPFKTITDVIEAIAKRKVDNAVIPVENSIEGGVSETLDSLLNVEQVYVTNEYVLPINHCLVAVDESALEEITHIYAHPQSFAQCRDFLRKNCSHVEKEIRSSNSAAAKAVSQLNDSPENIVAAAIAPDLCAEIYNLKVLKQSINDEKNNVTRFWVLSQEPSEPSGSDKTTLIFKVKDEPGSLVRILKYFAEAEINLSRIESRPSKKNLGEYTFCLDINIHKEDDRFAEVMKKVKLYFSYCKWLGSYSLIS